MKRALYTVLLLLLAYSFAEWAGWLPQGCWGRGDLVPARVKMDEKLPLYAYTFLGIELRSFEEDEYQQFRQSLAPEPEGKHVRMVPGEPAFLGSGKTGLIITRVLPGSPAEAAGLQENDMLLSVSCASMNNPADLLVVMRNGTAGVPLHLCLIRDKRWQSVQVSPVARMEPALVGYIIPRQLCAKHAEELENHQSRAIDMLCREQVPVEELCNELEAICQILYKGYTPGCLRLPLRGGDCRITATRCGWTVELRMQEGGQETIARLDRFAKDAQTLPDSIRHRLQELELPHRTKP